MHASVLMDRNDKTSLYWKVKKALLSCLDVRNRIYNVLSNEIKRYSNEIRNKFNNLFSIQYFTSMKTTGKTEIYHKIKNPSIWKVFRLKSSTGITRVKIYCNLCDWCENEISTSQIKGKLKIKSYKSWLPVYTIFYPEYDKYPFTCQWHIYKLLFSHFCQERFSLVKFPYMKRTSVPPC